MLSKNNSQTFILAGAALLFLCLFALYYLLLMPSKSKLNEQSLQISNAQAQVELISKKVAEKQKSTPTMPIKDIQAALPLWDNIEQLTLDLNNLKTATNVSFSSISYTTVDKPQQQADASTKLTNPNVKEVKVTAALSGTYDEIIATIAKLQKLPRIITIETVNFGSLPKDLTKKITANLSFKAYYDPSYKSKVDKVESPY
ncbi:type 4a pilus biogenesis protein PilO [Paenibacillus aestuarii]|uniref:Type 4a pilus biogenesis protein PilO n=1 Tax=Paenibacillus aestuarii TaxID=516965 RepID=A0ABW0KK16_9BACL|nr:hypothetical protein [Paenibacillus aestuarii]